VSLGSNRNEINLIGRPAADRAMLEKMRSKLVTTVKPADAQRPIPRPISHRTRRNRKSWTWVIVGVLFLGTCNVLINSEEDLILSALGIKAPDHLAAPKARLSQFDKARFWAYAAYNQHLLRTRFKVGAEDVIDPIDAAHHLAIMIQQGLPAPLLKEIEALKNSRLEAGK
jgi:hypothetical protein